MLSVVELFELILSASMLSSGGTCVILGTLEGDTSMRDLGVFERFWATF
jgi:hypothetical protein